MPRYTVPVAFCFYHICAICIIDSIVAFVPSQLQHPYYRPSSILLKNRLRRLATAKGESDRADNNNVPSDATLLASLKSRLAKIKTDRNAVIKRWREGTCTSAIRLALDDWIRRIDVAQWPLAVVGGASGCIYLADLSSGDILVKTEDAHDSQGGDEEMLEQMFGNYDGGGMIDVAVGGPNGRLVASAGREGGALAWRIGGSDSKDEEIFECLGQLVSLEGLAVTCLNIDGEGLLWAGCYDGSVHCIHLSNLVEGEDPKHRKFQCDSSVLSIDVSEDIDLVAVGTSSGAINLISSDEDHDESKGKLRKLDTWIPKKGVPVRSIGIAPFPIAMCDINDGENDSSERDYESEDEFAWSLVSGGYDGYLHTIPLKIDRDSGVIHEKLPLGEPAEINTVVMQPAHSGPVMCISYRKGGIILSGAQDGTIRVWDFTPRCASDAGINQGVAKVAYDPVCLYGLGGYKVWLGSISTGGDGLRLISDGSDNTIVVHNFSQEGDEDSQEIEDDDGGDSDDFDNGGNNYDDETAFM